MSVDPTPQCRAVVFDMDGTMFDSEILYFHVGVELLKRRGLDFTTELSLRIMGVPGRDSMRIVKAAHDLPESPDELYDESQSILRQLLDAELRFMPGVLDLLDRLEARGIPKGVATSTERDLSTYMLESRGILPRFQFVLTRNDVEKGKPHPEIYWRACELLGLAPEEVLVLEDSLTGTLSASAAGCHCVAIPHELSRALDFSHAKFVADGVLDERILRLVGLE